MWQKKPDGVKRTWVEAKRYCEGLSLSGYSDWRLPSKEVLKDIFKKKKIFDSYKQNTYFWSSTIYSDYTNKAWNVGFRVGDVYYQGINMRFYVRCVRDEKPLQSQNYTEIKKTGTVIDQATGLMWQKKPDGISRTLELAKQYCQRLRIGGFSDWTLPKRLLNHFKWYRSTQSVRCVRRP